MSKPADPFASIDLDALATVAGGAARKPSTSDGSDAQVTALLTQITDSLKNLGNQNSGGDNTTQLLMMMLMMGGLGGGGGVVAAAPCAAQPVVTVDSSAGGCRPKKGW